MIGAVALGQARLAYGAFGQVQKLHVAGPVMSRVTGTILVLLAGAAVGAASWAVVESNRNPTPRATGSAADDLQRTLLSDNVGRRGDSLLSALFVEIAARHFEGQLAPIPVRWEPGLGRVGELEGRAYTLQGMFGVAGGRSVILLNPEIQSDGAAVVRALCHEMVHAYLHAIGDDSTTHGPAFQAVLRRLSEEGAFEGVAADPEERARVRAWLDAESARLDAERTALAELGEDIRRERAEIEQALIATASATGAAEDPAALAARRGAHNDRASAANARTERFNRDLERFQAEVARYNLMVVYPDGRTSS